MLTINFLYLIYLRIRGAVMPNVVPSEKSPPYQFPTSNVNLYCADVPHSIPWLTLVIKSLYIKYLKGYGVVMPNLVPSAFAWVFDFRCKFDQRAISGSSMVDYKSTGQCSNTNIKNNSVYWLTGWGSDTGIFININILHQNLRPRECRRLHDSRYGLNRTPWYQCI